MAAKRLGPALPSATSTWYPLGGVNSKKLSCPRFKTGTPLQRYGNSNRGTLALQVGATIMTVPENKTG